MAAASAAPRQARSARTATASRRPGQKAEPARGRYRGVTRDAAFDHQQFRATHTFAALDGIRGAMVLWVVLFHCEPSRLGLQFLRCHGDLAVDVFFALSGFLITTLLLREPPAPLAAQVGRFYARRSLRIFPLYYAGVLLYWVAVHAFGRPEAVEQYREFLPSLLGYWSDWKLAFADGFTPQFVQAWSLAVEEKFYLGWPLLVLVWPRATLRIAVVGIAIVVGWRALLLHGGVAEARLYHAFELRLDALLWGACAAALAHDQRGYAWVRRAAHPAVFWPAVLAMVAVALGSTNADGWRYVAAPLSATVLIVGVVVRPTLAGTRWLQAKWLRGVGTVSYGIYIVHPLCLQVGQRLCGGRPGAPVDGLWEFAIGAPLSIAAAAASWRWFERPFLRLKERFRSGSAPVPAGTPAAATNADHGDGGAARTNGTGATRRRRRPASTTAGDPD